MPLLLKIKKVEFILTTAQRSSKDESSIKRDKFHLIDKDKIEIYIQGSVKKINYTYISAADDGCSTKS